MTTTNKGLIQPTNGSYVDTWDQPVNNDWSYIDTAFGGVVSLNATGISAHTLTLTEYRPLIIEVTGAISNNVVYTIPSGIGGQWIVYNYTTDATGGPWTISFTCAGSGYSISCPRATTTNLMCDGVNVNFADGRPGSPGGSNTQVQYNNNGTLAGSSNFVFTGTNVGIGTASPTNSLHLYYNSTSQTSLNVEAGAAATYAPGIYLSDSRTGSVKQFQLSVGGYSNSFYVQDMTASAVRMLIDTNGNVGIGTTAPSGKLQVQVSGTSNPSFIAEDGLIVSSTAGSGYTNAINIVSGSTGTAKLKFSSSATNNLGYTNYDMTTNSLQFGTNSSERMRIDSSGNVGIGTTSPSQKLQVQTTGDAVAAITSGNGYSSYLFLGKAATTNAAYITYDNGNNMIFQVNASERMRIDSSGNVGIGTTLPSSQLSVANNISAGLGLFFGSNANYWYQASSTQGTLRVGAFGSYSYFNFISSASGPQLAGSTLTFSGNSGANEHMRIASNGFVGIGTTSPGNSLVVAGTIQSISGGFEFPDNTVQTTAATTTPPATGTGSLYTYALLQYLGGAIAAGTNVTSNGSNLVYVDAAGVGSQYIPAGQIWQAMGYGNAPTLFQRTS